MEALPQCGPGEQSLVRRSGGEVPLKLICSSYTTNGGPQLGQFRVLHVSNLHETSAELRSRQLKVPELN